MEKKKFKLEELSVNSFVTRLNNDESVTVDGGVVTFTATLVTTLPAIISLSVASYAQCKNIGEDIGTAYSNNLCGDSMGFFCKLITV
jgi:hypothetical protein